MAGPVNKMPEAWLLDIQGLTLSIGAGQDLLTDISLQVRRGEALGLIGESGAGKSMIGRAIAGVQPEGFVLTSRSMIFSGRELSTLSEDERRALLGREIGFIPQEPMTALNPGLTVGQQFGEHLARLGVKRGNRKGRATDLLGEVGLTTPDILLGRYPHQLSGGMLQRVLIAMAFSSNPKLVIADEPTTALDVTIQARVLDLINRMRVQHDTAVLFITHDLRLASEVCNKIAVLYAGHLIETGSAEKVLRSPAHPYSRCLQLASPSLDGPQRELYVLPDTMPSLSVRAKMPGCTFAPRCPLSEEACNKSYPPVVTISSGHMCSCLKPDQTSKIVTREKLTVTGSFGGAKQVLVAKGLGKVYQVRDWLGRRHPVNALRGISFDIREREFVGVVGESGSGKSTLTKLIMGLEDVTSGTLQTVGIDEAAASAKQRRDILDQVQLVFQDPQSALNPNHRVGTLVTQIIDTGRSKLHQGPRDDLARQALAGVAMHPEMISRFPGQLSGGQKQRVNIARALFAKPRLLIADEIVSGLDVSVQAQILELLQSLRDEADFALMLISHDLSVVRHLCDRVLVMCKGEIVEQGPVDEVFSRPQHDYTRKLIAAAGGR